MTMLMLRFTVLTLDQSHVIGKCIWMPLRVYHGQLHAGAQVHQPIYVEHLCVCGCNQEFSEAICLHDSMYHKLCDLSKARAWLHAHIADMSTAPQGWVMDWGMAMQPLESVGPGMWKGVVTFFWGVGGALMLFCHMILTEYICNFCIFWGWHALDFRHFLIWERYTPVQKCT